MAVIAREALPDDLQPYESDLFRIIQEGLSLYLTRYGNQRANMSIKTERCGINDCLIEVARKFFPGEYAEKRGLFLLCLGPYRIKIKKLNKKLLASNYPTQLVFAFLAQKLDDFFTGDLFSSVPIVNLHLGYIPDEIDLLKSTSWVVRPYMTKLDWIYELKPEPIKATDTIPIIARPDVSSSSKPVVTPKHGDVPDTGTTEKSN